jgi:hypothetical protein
MLESRMLLTGNAFANWLASYSHPSVAAIVSTAVPLNTAPIVAQAISVNNNAAITGRTASLSILGRDDASESKLTYTWSVTAAPSGGAVGFSINGTNAAKNATATFTKAGTYQLAARIVDTGGLSVTSVKSVIVSSTLTSIGLSLPTGQAVSPSSTLVVPGTSQALGAQGLDQFGYAMAAQPALTWSITTVPTGFPKPGLTIKGAGATVTFAKAGTYGLAVQAKTAAGAAVVTNVSMNVAQTLTAVRNASTTPVSVSGTTLQPVLPTFVDQFGNALAVAPVLTWSTTSLPQGAPAPAFTTSGGVTTVTFGMAGSYALTARAANAPGISFVTTVIVNQTLASITVSPNAASIVQGATQQFTAQALDQFGKALSTQPAFTWSITTVPSGASAPSLVTQGASATETFSKTGVYGLAVRANGTGGVSITTTVSITVAQAVGGVRNVSTTPVNVWGTSAQLAVPTFVDQFGNVLSVAPALTWSTTSLPVNALAPQFTTQGGVTTASFAMAGSYTLNARVTSAPSISFVTTVYVNQTLTSIILSPNTASVLQGATQQFTPQALDQFRQSMANQQNFTWSTSAGAISTSGLFTAPSSGTSCTVTAKSGTVMGAATVTILANSGNLQDAKLATLVQSLDADGSISRNDMIQILRSVSAVGTVGATDFSDLKKILNQAATLNMPSYVQVLAGDVINGNAANATYQGQTLGNLAVGSSATQLNNLIGKWFLGSDEPALCNTSLVYRSAAGSLFPHTPSHTDEYQGELGDCYFISALGTLADSNSAAVQNMFIDNGDGTFTVRFYTGTYGVTGYGSDGGIGAGFTNTQITADYVTVDRMLPTGTSGILAYADYGANYANSANSLWIPLAEKAYAQWNQTGKEGRDGTNAYASIQGGWMATVDAQVLGHNATDYIMTSTKEQVAISALTAKKAVTIGTLQWSGTNLGLYGSHAYAIIGYNASTDKFTLYNPWGSDQPGQLTWSQLQATCTQMAVCDTSGSVPISAAVVKTASLKTSFSCQTPDTAGVLLSESSAAISTQPDLATTAPSSPSAATSASQKLFAMLDQNAAMQYQPYVASPVHRVLSPRMVDATFTVGDLLSWQDEALAALV